MTYVGNIKANQNPTIALYDYEVKKWSENNDQDPSLHIIAKV